MSNIRFQTIDFPSYISKRAGEVRLGEQVKTYQPDLDTPHFVLLGVQEDVGIRRNGGIGNKLGVYELFLKSFLNIQENEFLSGNIIAVDGFFSIIHETEDCLQELDDALSHKIQTLISEGHTPLVIGGGHNNSYGMIKGAALSQKQPVHVINLDAHADLRTIESRHSGNGFSQAKSDGYLHKYAMFGLHEGYNNTHILTSIQNDSDIKAVFYEDIVLRQKYTFEQALEDCLSHVNSGAFGVEWDVDSMEGVLSSALSPLGWSAQQVMRFLYAAGRRDGVYLHISEAVAEREDGLKNPTIGKLLSYAVQAFIKGKLEQ